jgi:hypothetical protein
MPRAELIRPLFATANYSYDTRRIAGNGHTLTGDAFAFVDPMFSSDVLMAMSSCAFAAQAIDVWLENRKAGERLLRDYERKMRCGLDALSWLIHRINRMWSVQGGLAPVRSRPDLAFHQHPLNRQGRNPPPFLSGRQRASQHGSREACPPDSIDSLDDTLG